MEICLYIAKPFTKIEMFGEQVQEIEKYTLFELLNRVKDLVADSFSEGVWVVGEIASIRNNWPNGHCYLELHQTEERTSKVIAKANAHIWRSRNYVITQMFREHTGGDLSVGMKVLLYVKVDFSESWGFSLDILDIEPSFTIGELELQKRKTLERLQNERLIDANKELALPILPCRLAIVSAEGAAGYGDFLQHLEDSGISFKKELFSAPMQGNEAPNGIFAAFDAINKRKSEFDLVVFIRGGGGELDLACFDDYLVAKSIATCHLPVISGIGHERDNHICDIVASLRVKTPTAAADYIIGCFEREKEKLINIQNALLDGIEDIIIDMKDNLDKSIQRFISNVRGRVSNSEIYLERVLRTLGTNLINRINTSRVEIDRLKNKLFNIYSFKLQRSISLLEIYNEKINSANPKNILGKGYALIDVNGSRVVNLEQIKEGVKMRVQMIDGIAEFKVTDIKIKKNKIVKDGE